MSARAQWVSYSGMAVSMVGGASWPRPQWWLVGVGLLIVGAGIVLMRRAAKGQPEPAEHGAHGAHGAHSPPGQHGAPFRENAPPTQGDALRAVTWMRDETIALQEALDTMKLSEVPARVEKIQADGTERYAAAQEELVRKFGFPKYASVMAPLATAERWLYRAWSASSDGHHDETRNSLVSAVEAAREAADAAEALEKERTTARAG